MNIKKLAVDAAIQASAPTPPDTATDAGRVVLYQVRRKNWLGKWVPCTKADYELAKNDSGWDARALVLASDLDAVTVELMEQCRIVGMGAERELALQAKLDAVTAERDSYRAKYAIAKNMQDAKLEVVTAEAERWKKAYDEQYQRVINVGAVAVNSISLENHQKAVDALDDTLRETAGIAADLRNQLAAKEKECERLREALVEVQAARYREQGMKVEQSYIHAKCDVDRERIRFAREALATGGRHD